VFSEILVPRVRKIPKNSKIQKTQKKLALGKTETLPVDGEDPDIPSGVTLAHGLPVWVICFGWDMCKDENVNMFETEFTKGAANYDQPIKPHVKKAVRLLVDINRAVRGYVHDNF
jgi:hypothetical protein